MAKRKRLGDGRLGERLQARARELGVSASVLAKAVGVNDSAVYKVFSGERGTSLEIGLAWARVLQLDPYELAFGTKLPATFSVEGSPPQDERLGKIESDLREMRKIVERLEDAPPGAGADQGGRRKGRRSA